MVEASACKERTFIMIKPDGVQRGLLGEIISRFEKKGFKLAAMKLCSPGLEHMKLHYADLATKKFFPGLVEYMVSGPVCAMVWEGDNAVVTGRKMLGATMPVNSEPGTIRGDLCIDVGRNICHGSDSVDSANHEIGLWFKADEIVNWASHSAEWVYENPEPVAAPKLLVGEQKEVVKVDVADVAENALSPEEAARIQAEFDNDEACIAARKKAEMKISRNENEVKARQAAEAAMKAETEGLKKGVLHITVEKAEMSIMIKGNPWFVINGIDQAFEHKTAVVDKTKKPVWGSSFDIPIDDYSRPVKFTFMKQDENGDEYIGDGSFRPMIFCGSAPPNFPLMNKDTKRMVGKCFLKATWEPTQ